MQKQKIKDWTPTKVFLGIVLFVIILIFIWAPWAKAADKTPSVNLGGYSTPVDTTTAWFTFWNDHVEYQQTGKSWYYPHAKRHQMIGSYTEIIADYPFWLSASAGEYGELIQFFDNLGIHHDSAFAHFSDNTYNYPDWDVTNSYRLTPGWDPANDANHNWVRDYKADYDWNNTGDPTTNFTASDTTITDNGGGQGGSWTTNEWTGSYFKMGYGGGATVWACTVTTNTANVLHLKHTVPSTSPQWFIVDKGMSSNHEAVAMTDSVAHMGFFQWGLEYFNISDSRVRAWAGKYCHQVVNDIASEYEAPGWLYIDDVQKDMQVKHVVYGGTSLEGWNNSTTFRTAIVGLYQRIRDSLGWGHGIIANIANYGISTEPEGIVYDTLSQYFNGCFHEYIGDMTQSTGDINATITFLKRQYNAPWNLKVHGLHFSDLPINGSYDRNKVAALAFYYIVKNDSTYMLYDCTGQYGILYGDTTNWYYGLMGVDIGTPTDTATYVTYSPNYWTRPFTKGKVILKLRDNSQNYTDHTTISLGGYYYLMDVNGAKVGDSINSISIMNADGAILQKATLSQDSLIQHLTPPIPLYPVNGAMVWRDSVINLFVTKPTDSVVFKIGTYNSFDSLYWITRFVGADTGNLVVMGLQENTLYYYASIAFEGVHRDTTAITAMMTESAPPLTLIKRIRGWKR